jgi:microcystin-dependent protein
MGSSAFEPVVLADLRSVKNKVSLAGITSDVITAGDVIRYDPSTDTYLRAKADTETNANFFGVVESVSGTDFTIVYSGEITLPDSVMSLISGYTGAQVFYLSDTDAGKLTTTAPSAPSHVIKPVIITRGTVSDVDGSVDGIVVNSAAGTKISGDSIVDLSDIQPVGSILAFAGNTGQIPTGWDICDGGYLDVTTYSDLYSALNSGKLYGFVQNLQLTKVTGSGLGQLTADNIVGSVLYVTKSASTSAFKCTILSGTVSGTVVSNVNVFVEPTYASGTLTGTYHNIELALNDLGRLYSGSTPLDMVYQVTTAPTKTYFKKPDMRARFIIGSSRGITGLENSGFNSYTIGNLGGEEYHTLTTLEMPVHTHDSSYFATLNGTVSVSHNLQTNSVGSHIHPGIFLRNTALTGGFDSVYSNVSFNTDSTPLQAAGTHNHTVSGDISVSTNDLTPNISGTISNAGGDLPHNNVPQHIVMYWIIKTRKDSYAKLYKLGPSGGGAIVAKNTAKRWARMSTPGSGCTVDISYGTWGVARLGTGHYQFTHDLINDLGTADQTKYIVETTVAKGNSGATQMFISNPYDLQGITFGVRIYDIMGATFSDGFQYLNLTIYGGGTAI